MTPEETQAIRNVIFELEHKADTDEAAAEAWKFGGEDCAAEELASSAAAYREAIELLKPLVPSGVPTPSSALQSIADEVEGEAEATADGEMDSDSEIE